MRLYDRFEKATDNIIGKRGTSERKAFERTLKSEWKPYLRWSGKLSMSEIEYLDFLKQIRHDWEVNFIYKLAKKAISSGNSREQVFEELQPVTGIPDEQLAKIITEIPTLNDRKKYRFPQAVFISLILLTILSNWLMDDTKVFSIIYVLLLVGALTYSTGFHKAIAILGILGLLLNILTSIILQFHPASLANIMFSLAVVYLGFHLNNALYSSYYTVKQEYTDGNGNLKERDFIMFGK